MCSVCPGNGPCWCLLQEAPRTSNNAFEGSALIKACGKLELLSKMLRHIYGSEHRVLIFSQVGWVWGWSCGTAQRDAQTYLRLRAPRTHLLPGGLGVRLIMWNCSARCSDISTAQSTAYSSSPRWVGCEVDHVELLSEMLRHIYGSEHRVLIFSQVGWVWGWSCGTAQRDAQTYLRLRAPCTHLLPGGLGVRLIMWNCSARCSDISTAQSTVYSSSPRWVGCEVDHVELLSEMLRHIYGSEHRVLIFSQVGWVWGWSCGTAQRDAQTYLRLRAPCTHLLPGGLGVRLIMWNCSARCSDISTAQSTVYSSSPRWVGCEVDHVELLSEMLRHIYGSEHRVLIFSQVGWVWGWSCGTAQRDAQTYLRLRAPCTHLLPGGLGVRLIMWNCSARCSDISTAQSTVYSSSPRWVGCEVDHVELLSKMLRHIYGSEHRVLIFSQVGWVWGWSCGTAQQDTSHFYILLIMVLIRYVFWTLFLRVQFCSPL